MTRTHSLRFRLGLFVTVIAGSLTLVASLLIGVVRWQDQNDQLEDAVRLAAFQLAENGETVIPALDIGVAGDTFAVLLGDPPEVLAQQGDLPESLLLALIDQVWNFTIDNGNAVSVELDDFDVVAAGAFCTDGLACDTAIVGVHRQPLGSFLSRRWAWLAGVPFAIGLIALATSRWLIARALTPVDRMRAELDDITASDLGRRVPVPKSNDELATLGRSMNATIGRLGAAVAANERFVADAAHELRSPITGARAAFEIEAMTTGGGLAADGIGELDRAGRLIDDLLVLARRQGGPRIRVDVDVDDLVRTEINGARSRFPDVDIGGVLEPARLQANPDDVRRVIGNLLENACRYGDKAVQLAVSGSDDNVVVTVDDDGPGIPAEHRLDVFERFTRLDESRARSTGGSGLGLAIVHELVSGLGGTVAIGNSSLGGASLRVELPVKPNADS